MVAFRQTGPRRASPNCPPRSRLRAAHRVQYTESLNEALDRVKHPSVALGEKTYNYLFLLTNDGAFRNFLTSEDDS